MKVNWQKQGKNTITFSYWTKHPRPAPGKAISRELSSDCAVRILAAPSVHPQIIPDKCKGSNGPCNRIAENNGMDRRGDFHYAGKPDDAQETDSYQRDDNRNDHISPASQ